MKTILIKLVRFGLFLVSISMFVLGYFWRKEEYKYHIVGDDDYFKKIRLIKEYASYPNVFIVRTNCYGKSYKFVSRLIHELKKDFPNADDSKIEVVRYGGIRYARTMGIEWYAPKGTIVPDHYDQKEYLENA